jgi:hypothetical protein
MTRRRSQVFAPHSIIPDDPDVLPALRDLFSQHPAFQELDVCELVGWLRDRGYMSRRATEAEVEAALQALIVEGEILT